MKEEKSKVIRFGVSVEKEILEDLDTYMRDSGYQNRSQAIRSLITKVNLKKQWTSNQIVGGSIMMSYDHHKRDLLEKITEIQHNYHSLILCSQHIHLDHTTCMEIIALKGEAFELQKLANELIGLKGISHGELSITII